MWQVPNEKKPSSLHKLDKCIIAFLAPLSLLLGQEYYH